MKANNNNFKGPFYFNPKDSRVIVPKQNPALGWTLNMGNVYSYILMILVILIILYLIF